MDDGELILVEMKNGRRFRWEVLGKDATCQRCGAPIWWVVTHKGNRIPVDEPELGEELTTSHFDTCQSQPART
jgi:hypothetical protein